MVPRSSLPLSQSNAYTVVLHTRTPGVQSYTHTLHYPEIDESKYTTISERKEYVTIKLK